MSESRGQNAIPAFREWLSRRKGDTVPEGSYAPTGIWFPTRAEHRDCCDRVKPGTLRHKDTLRRHCLTVEHCAALHNADLNDVRSLVWRYHRAMRAELSHKEERGKWWHETMT